MPRVRLLLLASLALMAVLPAAADARAPGLARVEGSGVVDFSAVGRAQVFGELNHGRVLWYGRGRPRVISCADRKPLKRCAVRRTYRGATEWQVYKPARIFLVNRNFRLLIEDAGRFEISITGRGTLALNGTGRLTMPGQAREYTGAEDADLQPTPRRRAPRGLP